MDGAWIYADNIDDIIDQVQADTEGILTHEEWKQIEKELVETLARDESMEVGGFDVGVTNMDEEEFNNLLEFVG